MSKLNYSIVDLYHADEKEAILRRQNGRFTHTYNVPIKSAGTTLFLLRYNGNSRLTSDGLRDRIIAGNGGTSGFVVTYYQLLAECDLTSTITGNGPAKFTGTLTLNFRTNITPPASGATTKPEELFVANSLQARAARQASRTAETIQTTILDEDITDEGDGQRFYLVLMAAKDNDDNPYIFKLGDDSTEEKEETEETDAVKIKDFLNGKNGIDVTMVRILGYFPGDRIDFKNFTNRKYSITVSGNGNLTIAEKTEETEQNS